jgi:hypothetical protein
MSELYPGKTSQADTIGAAESAPDLARESEPEASLLRAAEIADDQVSVTQHPIPSVLEGLSRESPSPFSEFLSYLVFEGNGLRLFLEAALCLCIFIVIEVFFASIALDDKWRSLGAWMIACVMVAILDHLLLIPPLFAYRRAWASDATANLDGALKALDEIAPDTKSLIRYPRRLYHLRRGQFYLNAGQYSQAERELGLAAAYNLPFKHSLSARLSIMRLQGSFEKAEEELNEAKLTHGNSPEFALEEALTALDQRKDLRHARKLFDSVLEQKNVMLHSEIMTHDLARPLRELCRLWTGYAEEALSAFSAELQVFVSIYGMRNEEARPWAARMMLERAYYLATHREPELATRDLRVAQIFYRNGEARRHAQKVQEELEWRFKNGAQV